MRSLSILLALAAFNAFAATITPVGPMVAARQTHTATLLADGRVLIAGGDAPIFDTTARDTAELYDPARRVFLAAGKLSTVREQHAAVALPDGRVMIVAGFRASAATWEFYNPATATFSNPGSISGERAEASATLLADGRVLLAGGRRSNAPQATAEIYNTLSSSWISTGSMTVARSGHAAVRLGNGSVLVAGSNSTPSEIYDPNTGVFTSLPNSSSQATSGVLLPNGTVVLVGLGFIQTLDPVTRTFTASSARLQTYRGEAVVALPDGSVLIAGGSLPTSPITRSTNVLIYLAKDTLTTIGTLSVPRDRPTATLLLDGTVLIAGGYTGSGSSAAAEIIDFRASRSRAPRH